MTAKVDASKCNGCGACKEICPVNAIKINNSKAVIGDNCVGCGACIGQCSNDAISI